MFPMKRLVGLLALLFVAVLPLSAYAGAIACSTGTAPVTSLSGGCNPGQSYGAQFSSSTSAQFLAADAGRSGVFIQVPSTSSNSCCVEFQTDGTAASASAPANCYEVKPGNPLYFTNFRFGGQGGVTVTSAISAIGMSGTCNLTFSFFQ